MIGTDPFLLGEALADLLGRLAGEVDDMGSTRVDGSRAALAEVLDEVRTLSLLGGRRVVVVEEADPFVSTHRAAMERYCESPSGGGCLILLCRSMPKNTRLYKIITKTGTVVTTEAPKGRGVVSWLMSRARTAHGKTLSQPAAQRLREHLGDALGVLDAELAKLAAYAGTRAEIVPADIDALTGHHREEKVFAVTDAMSAGDTAAAIEHWEQVLATDRAAPGRAIAGLAWGIRRLLATRRDFEVGVSVRELSRRMYMEPGILEQRLRRVTVDSLEAQQRDLLRADLEVKTGVAALETAVERFIVEHTARAAPSRN